jgi:SOS response associated peptidase (SRAP)
MFNLRLERAEQRKPKRPKVDALGPSAVVGARFIRGTGHDQRPSGDVAREALVQAARGNAAMSCSGRRLLRMAQRWQAQGATVIHLKNREPFAFAELWDHWRDPAGEKDLYTFAIITTDANALLRPIHNRMPVIYDKAMGRQWLEQSFGASSMSLAAVLQPLPSELMEAHEVSTLVNSPENDTAACIQTVSAGQRIRPQLPLL